MAWGSVPAAVMVAELILSFEKAALAACTKRMHESIQKSELMLSIPPVCVVY